MMMRVAALFAILAVASANTKYMDVKGVIDVSTPSTKQITTGELSTMTAASGENVTITVTTTENTADWSTVTLRLCYAPESQKDRKWRKTKDNFKKNTQCKQPGLAKIAKLDWPTGTTSLTHTFKPDENVAEGIYFVEAFAQDANKNYLAKGNSKEKAFFKIIGWEAVDSGLIAAAAILSALSWTSLAAYWVKDLIFKPSK